VDQAGRLVRAASALVAAPDTGESFRESLRQSIPDWEAQVQVARSHLAEALKMEWADDSRAGQPLAAESGPKKRATRIQGNWRESLKSRCHAQHALFRFLQSMGKLMEDYWVPITTDDAPATHAPVAKEFFDQAEEFIVGRAVNFLAVVFPAIQNLGFFVLAGLLLMLLAVTSYPFQPRNEFLFFNWVVILCFVGTVFWIFVQMDRDTILSLLNDTVPGQVNFSRELVLRTLLYVAVPLMALLGAQFPESLRQILSLFTAAQAG
jgi:gas vesicle protein